MQNHWNLNFLQGSSLPNQQKRCQENHQHPSTECVSCCCPFCQKSDVSKTHWGHPVQMLGWVKEISLSHGFLWSWSCKNIYFLLMTNIANWKITIEIVDFFPLKNVILHSFECPWVVPVCPCARAARREVIRPKYNQELKRSRRDDDEFMGASKKG